MMIMTTIRNVQYCCCYFHVSLMLSLLLMSAVAASVVTPPTTSLTMAHTVHPPSLKQTKQQRKRRRTQQDQDEKENNKKGLTLSQNFVFEFEYKMYMSFTPEDNKAQDAMKEVEQGVATALQEILAQRQTSIGLSLTSVSNSTITQAECDAEEETSEDTVLLLEYDSCFRATTSLMVSAYETIPEALVERLLLNDVHQYFTNSFNNQTEVTQQAPLHAVYEYPVYASTSVVLELLNVPEGTSTMKEHEQKIFERVFSAGYKPILKRAGPELGATSVNHPLHGVPSMELRAANVVLQRSGVEHDDGRTESTTKSMKNEAARRKLQQATEPTAETAEAPTYTPYNRVQFYVRTVCRNAQACTDANLETLLLQEVPAYSQSFVEELNKHAREEQSSPYFEYLTGVRAYSSSIANEMGDNDEPRIVVPNDGPQLQTNAPQPWLWFMIFGVNGLIVLLGVGCAVSQVLHDQHKKEANERANIWKSYRQQNGLEGGGGSVRSHISSSGYSQFQDEPSSSHVSDIYTDTIPSTDIMINDRPMKDDDLYNSNPQRKQALAICSPPVDLINLDGLFGDEQQQQPLSPLTGSPTRVLRRPSQRQGSTRMLMPPPMQPQQQQEQLEAPVQLVLGEPEEVPSMFEVNHQAEVAAIGVEAKAQAEKAEEVETQRIAEEEKANISAKEQRKAAKKKAKEEAEAQRIGEEENQIEEEKVKAEAKAQRKAAKKKAKEAEAQRMAQEEARREEEEEEARAEAKAQRKAAKKKAREEAKAQRIAEEEARQEEIIAKAKAERKVRKKAMKMLEADAEAL